MSLKNLNDYEGNKKIRDQNGYVLKILENEKFLPCPILFAYVIKKNENSNRLFCTHLNKERDKNRRISKVISVEKCLHGMILLISCKKSEDYSKTKKKKEKGTRRNWGVIKIDKFFHSVNLL